MVEPTVGVLGHPGSSHELVADQLFFNKVAGTAFSGPAEILPLVIGPDRIYMGRGVKILMIMAALAVINNDVIILCGGIASLKCLFQFRIDTARQR